MHRSKSRSLSLVASIALSLVTAGARAQPPSTPPPAVDPCAPQPSPCPAPKAAADPSTVAAPTTPAAIDRPQTEPRRDGPPPDARFLHGFRIGYGYTFKHDEPVEGLGGKSVEEKAGMRTPHHLLLGYEAFYRMVGHSWLNVLLVGNVMVAGLEQSKFFPSANLLIGFELANSFQVGVGANLSPIGGSEAHMILAAGWTPRVGSFYVPVHGFFIPDVDGVHRAGVTTGVTW